MSPKPKEEGVKKGSTGPGYKEEPAAVADHDHHPNPSQQGLPPPQHLQHHRPGVYAHHSEPPHQHQSQSSQQPVAGSYASSHNPSHSLPPQHPHYPTGHPVGPPPEVPYYTHPSTGPINTGNPSYSSAENIHHAGMATATMNRGYAPMYSTQTSASPASVQPPHPEHQSRPMYSQPPMYPAYSPYNIPQQSPYGQHPVQPAGSLPANFMTHQNPGQSISQHTTHPATPQMTRSPGQKLPQEQIQRQGPSISSANQTPPGPPGSAASLHHPHSAGSSANPNAAPGPIPATTPLVVRQDQNGVQWIAFEYSRDRVKMEYTIRCDVESVDVNGLTQDFKQENCVYPRACCPKDQYKGNRLHYESECNTVGWALTQLNPCLRGKRGLIQRAVDSWRNSNQDPRLRSRRVRRMAKINNRKAQVHQGAQLGNPGAPGSVPQAAMSAPSRQSGMSMGGGLMHHHHEQPGGPPASSEDVSVEGEHDGEQRLHQPPNVSSGESPTVSRQTHNFCPSFPPTSSRLVSSTVPSANGLDHMSPSTSHVVATISCKEEEKLNNAAHFGDLSETKRRKFILVDDAQRGTRVRVRVMLDQVRMAEMPDSYRKNNSVYPRSWFATEMQSPPSSPRQGRWPDDIDDESPISIARTLVPVPLNDGSESKLPVPRITRTKRSKEATLNDLGYRMSWSQSRVFSGRTLFLQRSCKSFHDSTLCLVCASDADFETQVDAYRNKMRSTMLAAGQDVVSIAPHFETRVGKRKWQERAKKPKHDALQ